MKQIFVSKVKNICVKNIWYMKVKGVEIANEMIRSDGWWRFACGDVYTMKSCFAFCKNLKPPYVGSDMHMGETIQIMTLALGN